VDSAVMVIDAAKGIEPQTLKLFEVCRKRGIPIFTFINKMDRPARDPLELLDEIKKVLGMEPIPMNWPIGDGPDFRGVYDRASEGVYLFERTERNERMAPEVFMSLDQLAENKTLTQRRFDELAESIHLLDEVGVVFDHESVLNEKQTPVFFGSAVTNFGVRLFLDTFVKYAPQPQPYQSDTGEVSPTSPDFSGFIFKIQANMNPKHRDSVAFLRICSGRFERGMNLIHTQSGKTLRLLRPYKPFANEREILDEAFPGDVLGIPNNGDFAIGDSLCAGVPIRFASIPRFQPEHFALLRNTDLGKQKQFAKGLLQLESEGAVQILYNLNAFKREPILAVVGQLQFDVVQARLKSEYNVPTDLERLPHVLLRWIKGSDADVESLPNRAEAMIARDSRNDWVALFSTPFFLRHYTEKHPELRFVDITENEAR
jgi:peptide chain release factor 3